VYIDSLPVAYPQRVLGDHHGGDVRLVSVDPNKHTLMQCVEVPSWVTGGVDVCGTKQPATFFRHTYSEQQRDRQSKRFQRKRDRLIQADVRTAEAAMRASGVSSKAVSVDGITAYLTAKHAMQAITRTVYENPAFRVLRWRAACAKQRADAKLIKRFASRYGGPDTTALVWGDWSETGSNGSPGHMRYSPPTRGIGLRRLFRKHGYHVWLVDEFLTSKRCHGCKSGYCSTFRYVENPRKSTHKHRPLVLRWGLTRCDRHTCRRLWDRDVNSALNILWIAVLQLVYNQERPACLSRRRPAAQVEAA